MASRFKCSLQENTFLEFERRDSCACLILDLRMPGLNGLQVQESIAAQTTIPVIFITGRHIPSTVSAMKGGAIDFLTKPIDETALLPVSIRHSSRIESSGYLH